MKRLICTVGALFLVCPELAEAGGCHVQQTYHAAYVPPVILQQFFGVGQGLQDEARLARALQPLRDEIKALRGEQANHFANLRSTLLSVRGSGTFSFEGSIDPTPNPTPGPAPQPIPDPQPTPQPVPDPVPDNGGASPAFTPQVAAILQAKCVQCHVAGGPQKPIDQTNTDANRASLIFLKTFSDDPAIRMPPDGSLNDSQREQIFQWATGSVKAAKARNPRSVAP